MATRANLPAGAQPVIAYSTEQATSLGRVMPHLPVAVTLPHVRGPFFDKPGATGGALPSAHPKWFLSSLRGELLVVASVEAKPDGYPWLHVSCSYPDRIPGWEDLAMVRRSFFKPKAVVVSVFPPVDEYVNDNPHVLHLWQRLTVERLVPDLREYDEALGKRSI